MAPKLNARVTVLSIVVPGPAHREGKGQSDREYEAARESVDDVVKEFVVAKSHPDQEGLSACPAVACGVHRS